MLGTNRKIRLMRDEDVTDVVRVWYSSGKSVYSFLPAWRDLTIDHALSIFKKHILPQCGIWVGICGETVESYLAMKQSYIDRLYVEPLSQRKGWGGSLLNYAKELYPEGLELHTHQENHGARAFYEQNSFIAVEFGISPPPESVPDVRYQWRP